jgi:hypothetical protein
VNTNPSLVLAVTAVNSAFLKVLSFGSHSLSVIVLEYLSVWTHYKYTKG